MNIQKINIEDIDVIYLSYDEPQREKFWIEIQNIVPWSRRVDGIKGSDSAHKAAAEASQSDRFILIDGDNLPDPKFFTMQLELDSSNINAVFRWRALNYINGLRYGNGGVSCWTKEFIRNMRTHENTDGKAETVVEFCFDPNYIAMYDCYSTAFDLITNNARSIREDIIETLIESKENFEYSYEFLDTSFVKDGVTLDYNSILYNCKFELDKQGVFSITLNDLATTNEIVQRGFFDELNIEDILSQVNTKELVAARHAGIKLKERKKEQNRVLANIKLEKKKSCC